MSVGDVLQLVDFAFAILFFEELLWWCSLKFSSNFGFFNLCRRSLWCNCCWKKPFLSWRAWSWRIGNRFQIRINKILFDERNVFDGITYFSSTWTTNSFRKIGTLHYPIKVQEDRMHLRGSSLCSLCFSDGLTEQILCRAFEFPNCTLKLHLQILQWSFTLLAFCLGPFLTVFVQFP